MKKFLARQQAKYKRAPEIFWIDFVGSMVVFALCLFGVIGASSAIIAQVGFIPFFSWVFGIFATISVVVLSVRWVVHRYIIDPVEAEIKMGEAVKALEAKRGKS